MKRLAIIPARGGSRRIPRKNVRDFGGAPVIDDEDIASVARQSGALIPFMRPAELADDFTPCRQVVNHAIKACETVWGRYDQVCCIYATAPLIEVDDLITAHHALAQSKAQFVFSAVAFEFPIQRAFRLNGEQQPTMIEPEHRFTRSQDLEPTYHDAAQFYWGHRDAFLRGLAVAPGTELT